MEDTLITALEIIEKLASALSSLQNENDKLRAEQDARDGFVNIVYGGETIKCYLSGFEAFATATDAYRDKTGQLHMEQFKEKRRFTFVEV